VGGYYKKRVRVFEFYSISHVIDGEGCLWFAEDDRERVVRTNQCIIVPPGHINRYGGAEKPFCEDHICFFGPIADRMMENGLLERGVFEFGATRRLLPIIEVASCPSRDAQFEANLMLQRLLFDMYRENRKTEKTHSSEIEQLLLEMKKNVCRWWTVSNMADFCHLSDDQLRRLFLVHVGMRPKEYIDSLKIRTAGTMLTERNWSVKQVADELGYRDRFHFSRRFKTIMGLSPQTYRERLRIRKSEK
jgi:AraC-like DNA-binding protein